MPDYADPPLLDPQQACQRLASLDWPWSADYLAMYSSWLQGIVTQPWLMSVPLDDHLVHRGDGVFEVSKCIGGRIYLFERHLERLAGSARAIDLKLPESAERLRDLAIAVVRTGGQGDCMVRIYASRGPGGFTTNPFECPQPGLYIMAGRIHPPKPQAYQQGVKIGLSGEPASIGFYTGIKTCNYLPNVMLKRQAVLKGWDFAVGLDSQGHLTEGSTENIGLVDQQGRLLLPSSQGILEGTTVRRAAELAQEMKDAGLLAGVEHRSLSRQDLLEAAEVMLFGTTLDVLPVTSLEDQPLGGGRPGPVAGELLERMRRDMRENPAISTLALAI